MPWGRGLWGWGYPPPYAPYGAGYGGYWGYGPSREEEKQMLQNWRQYLEDQKKYLDEQLERIDQRAAELEAAEESSQ